MFISTIMTVASISAACACASSVGDQQWLSGDHKVIPVVRELQSEMIRRLDDLSFIPIEVSLARSATGDTTLPRTRHYYLAKVGYIGGGRDPRGYPRGISFSVDVNSSGVAYVTSYRLTHEQGSSEIAVVLVSQSPLTAVVSLCGAAE